MKITYATESYNERRMGPPWIAKVDFSTATAEFAFGDWAGDSRNGGAGTLVIEAEAGDLIAIGQKDNRQPRNSAPTFYVVDSVCGLEKIGDKGAAYKFYLEQAPRTNRDDLIAERARLVARIAGIDKLMEED